MTPRLAAIAFAFVIAASACGDSTVSSTTAPTTVPPVTTTTPPEPATTLPATSTTVTTTTTIPPTTTTTMPPTSTTAPGAVLIAVTFADGEVLGPDEVTVRVGDAVRLEVTADVADEVHVHGYDLFGAVGPQLVAVVEFTADVPGIFEIELEGSGEVLLELTVEP